MKAILRLMAIAALPMMALAACDNSSNSDTITEQLLPGFFANVEDLTSGATAVYSNVSYLVDLNYTAMTADVQISGMKLPDGTAYPTMTFSGVPWGIDSDGWKVIKGTSLTPSISGYSDVPLFNSFEVRIYERIVQEDGNSLYSPGVCGRFTINSIYRVLSSYSPQTLYGETSSVDENNNEFESDAVEYVVTYNTDTRMLTILMNGARFAADMPAALNIELRNIAAEVHNGALTFDVASITPYIEDVPYETFPITNLRGSFDPGDDLEFSFNCNPRTAEGTYTVDVDCDYSRSSTVD